ncbi:MAG: hypothetical protein A2Z03_08465 [Chloroflexi bacterium RBG_16_56_8]|nr:MAG: hypothetical protein A2Z03_08465 [Chloroflexi bacterium RBG_16_56_8]
MIGALPHRIRQGKPGFIVLSVNYQRSGFFLFLLVDKQNEHLAIAAIRAVVRAGTIAVSQARVLQIERFHNAKTCAGQLPFNPGLDMLAVLIESQKRH